MSELDKARKRFQEDVQEYGTVWRDDEIERLKAEIAHKTTYADLLQDQVRVLKEKNKAIAFQYLEAQGEIEAWKENECRALLLITELVEALSHYALLNNGEKELINRAKEVTK